MQRLLSLATLVVLVALTFMFVKNFKLEGLDNVKVQPRGTNANPASRNGSGIPGRGVPPARGVGQGRKLRIATFNIQTFGQKKMGTKSVMRILRDIVTKFDIVAVQEIKDKHGELMIRKFVDQINSVYNRHYEFIISDRIGSTSYKEQYAFIYDTASVQVDYNSAYTISDPKDVLAREPLVAAFRVRGPAPDQAFTFCLVNVHTAPNVAVQEMDIMADVYRVVRRASQGEDDIIILGDFNTDARHLGRMGKIPGIMAINTNYPTNTRQTHQYDNILIHGPSTVEYTGRFGVVDLQRAYNLKEHQALDVSDHLPVWAEFSLYEGGGQAGRVASLPNRTTERNSYDGNNYRNSDRWRNEPRRNASTGYDSRNRNPSSRTSTNRTNSGVNNDGYSIRNRTSRNSFQPNSSQPTGQGVRRGY